jgi:hypothetical protein
MSSTTKKTIKQDEAAEAPPPPSLDKRKPDLQHIGGSKSDDWNLQIANQAVSSGWYGSNPVADRTKKQRNAILASLVGIQPADELEGMLAGQLVACHNAAMECYRRAMIPEQSFEGRRENLNQGNKLSRTYASLVEALNRHRGKGQQKVTVEHVHVHEGGQAIVGNVEGGGMRTKLENQSHALRHAPGETLRSEDQKREALPVASDGKR